MAAVRERRVVGRTFVRTEVRVAAREQACDEAVLALGTRPSSYAQVLLDFAESQVSPLRSLAALPIVERSLLEQRLMAILAHDSGVSRPRRPLIAAFTIAMVALALGAARPSASVSSSQLAVWFAV